MFVRADEPCCFCKRRVGNCKICGKKFQNLIKIKKHKEMKIVNYLKESYEELVHKTSWPTMQELGNSVVVVSIASLIIAFIVFLMDAVFNLGMRMMFQTV